LREIQTLFPSRSGGHRFGAGQPDARDHWIVARIDTRQGLSAQAPGVVPGATFSTFSTDQPTGMEDDMADSIRWFNGSGRFGPSRGRP
jgi:hypothetical protein